MAALEMKAIPMITTGLFCFALGAGAGIAWMTSTGYKTVNQAETEVRIAQRMPSPPQGSSKNQLAALVIKLDQLTGKPLTVDLSEERRARIRDLLDGVEDSVIHDDVARERLHGLLEVLNEDRPTLIAAGYRWPDTPRTPMDADPFAVPKTLMHLISLRHKLGLDAPSDDLEPGD